jgi:hypothetical protein
MTIFRFNLVLILAAIAGGCGATPTEAEQWSGSWTEPTSEVMAMLAKHSVRGCGEFYQKANSAYRGEYAVACNRMPDGSGKPAWVGYQVWTGSGDVLGPDPTAVFTKFGGPPKPDPR